MKSASNSFAFDQIISVQNGSFRGKEEKSIISIKKTRKLIENDAQILANRIALLRNEELKSWKRIEEAKKKAKEVYQIRVQAEEKLYRRENSRNKDDSLLMKRLQTPTSEIKKQGQLKRESIRQALQDQKHTEMLQIKQQREINEKKKKVFQNKMLENNRSKSQSVREQKNLSELRRNDYYVNKINQYRQMRETEVSFQENLKNQKVMEVLALGKMEVELVKKLQHTQEVEKSTVEQLEEAIHLPITEYKSKYQIKEVKRDSRKRISTPVIRLNQERSLQEIKKTDLNESVTSDRRSQSVLKDTPSLTRENRSHQSLERTERIKRIYGRPILEKGRSTGRESSDHSVSRSMEGRDSARKELKSRTKSRGGERNSTPGNLEEPKKTLSSSNQNRSLLIDVGR